MLSGLLLLITWLVAASLLSQASTLPKRIVPAIAFAGSQSFLFLFYLFLLPLGSANSAKLLLAVYALTGIAFFALRPLRLGNAIQTIRHFLQLQQSTSLSIMGENAIIRRYLLRTAKARIVVTLSAICLVLLCSILISSPSSWDSYTYNLARIAHMLIRRSPFIAQSPSLPQAIFPLGHDLLYYPDILLGNLRGLGIVNTLEFIVLIGALINLCDLVSSQRNDPQPKVACMLETAKLITICLIISSDQQIFQAISTKNDLVITVYFAVSCLTALAFLRHTGKFRLSILLCSALLLTVYAATCKSYGLICMIPFAILGVFKLRNSQTSRPLHSSGGFPSANLPISMGAARNTTFVLYILSAALSIFSFAHYSFSITAYSNLPEYQSSVGSLMNRYGNLFSYAKAAVLNGLRFLLSFAVYPYSTWLKPHATAHDDYWLDLSPIVKLLTSNHFAIADGYAFTLSRFRGEEFSLTSPLVQLTAFLAIMTLASCLLTQKKDNHSKVSYYASLRSVLDLQGVGLILFSSVTSSLLFFSVLAYHNWYVKYMGFSYVCLIPILSWLLVFNTAEMISHFAIPLGNVFNSPLLLIFKTFLIVLALTFLVGSLSLNSRFFSWSFLREASANNTYQFYGEYLNSRGLRTPEERQKFLSQFSGQHTKRINLCFGEETLSLAPLLELAKQNPDSKTIGLFPLGPKGCSPRASEKIVGKAIVLP
jgi:hypothetical protein